MADTTIASVETALGFRLPNDYREFLSGNNGGEGFVGKHYLIAWRVEELIPFNRDYQVNEYAPGILIFASSGGGEAFAFDTRDDIWPVVQVPFIGLDLDSAIKVADTFFDLLSKMSYSDESLI